MNCPLISLCFVPENRNRIVGTCVTIAILWCFLFDLYTRPFCYGYLFVSVLMNPCLLPLVQEWGDPRKEEYYYYMKSYSPVDNVSGDVCVPLGILFTNDEARMMFISGENMYVSRGVGLWMHALICSVIELRCFVCPCDRWQHKSIPTFLSPLA